MTSILKNKKTFIVAILAVIASICFVFGAMLTSKTTMADTSVSKIDTEEDMLRYGFNVTGGTSLLDGGLNFSNPILKPANSGWGQKVGLNAHSASMEVKSFSAESATALASQQGDYTSGGINAKIAIVNTDISTEFDTQSSSSETYEERYESYYQKISRYTYSYQGNVDLSAYLTDDFKVDLLAVHDVASAKALINKYGTHIFTSLSYGGILQVTNYMKTSEYKAGFSSYQSLGTKMEASFGNYAAGTGWTFSSTYATEEAERFGTSNYKLFSYGGKAVTGMTLDQLFKYSESMIDGAGHYIYDVWVQSINNRDQLHIVGANGSVPIWELLPSGSDMTIRTYLISAYAELCGDKYSEYMAKYPTSSRNVSLEEGDEGIAILGFSTEYKGNVKYYEIDDVIEPYGMAPGAKIFINSADSTIPAGKQNWKIISGENYVDVIDSAQGVFQVKESASSNKNFIVGVYNDETLIKTMSFTTLANGFFSGGSGTEEDPYLISTTGDFDNIIRNSSTWSAHFKLTNDIDFDNQSLVGIGNASNPFSGTFDGNNCKLLNLSLLDPTDYALGVFSYNAGTIKNLTVSNVTMGYGKDKIDLQTNYAGTFAGKNTGIITNCKVDGLTAYIKYEGTVVITNDVAVGGIAGSIESASAKIEECAVENVDQIIVFPYFKTNQDFSVCVGGIVGKATGGSIKYCYIKSANTLISQAQGHSRAHAYCAGGIGKASGSLVIEEIVIGTINRVNAAYDSYYGSEHKKALLLADKDGTDVKVSECYAQKLEGEVIGEGLDSNNCQLSDNKITFASAAKLEASIWQANKTDSFPVFIKQNFDSKTALDIIVDDAQTEFYYGQPFNITGVKVEGKYANSSESFAIEHFKYDASNYNPEVIGNYDIVIHAIGYSKAYTISVRKIKVVSLDVEVKEGAKFIVGSTLNQEDFIVKYVLEDGSKIALTDEIKDYISYPKTGVTISLSENKEGKFVLGENKVIAKAGDISVAIVAEAEERVVDSISITKAPTVTTYKEGQRFRPDGMEVTVQYLDGTSEVVSDLDLEIIGDKIEVGENKIIIAYDAYVTTSVSVTGTAVQRYTIVFKNWDGTEISSTTYKEGDTITVPANPTREDDANYTYTFTGWNTTVATTCTGNAVYVAQYSRTDKNGSGDTSMSYTVTFKDWDGSIISESYYYAGDTITVPANPTREDDANYTYTFTGWDKTVATTCTGNAVYVAQYSRTNKDGSGDTSMPYTVTFKNWDGSIIFEDYYYVGDTIPVPANPTREDDANYTYTFTGWDKTIATTCTGNAVYVAQYSRTDKNGSGGCGGAITTDCSSMIIFGICVSCVAVMVLFKKRNNK